MLMLAETALSWVASSVLIVPLTSLTGATFHHIEPQLCQRLAGGLGVNLGVWRLSGHALTGHYTVAWTLILKGWAVPPAHADFGTWDTPYREFLLYRDGILDDLPAGIRAPRCLGTEVNSSGMWLWLEDMSEAISARWCAADFAIAAHHLGRFNGTYLAGRRLPRHECLSEGWFQHWVENSGSAIRQMNATANEPLVRRVYPPTVARAFTALWERRHTVFKALNALPQTFCHRDAFSRNLTLMPGGPGGIDLVALDWEHAGVGVIGEEVAQLMAASLIFLDVPADSIDVFHAAILEAYTRGLRDTGWEGNPSVVRLGFAAAVALRTGVGFVQLTLPFLLEEQARIATAEFLGHDAAEITEQLETVVPWIADQAKVALAELPLSG
jgi:hypothetical protein